MMKKDMPKADHLLLRNLTCDYMENSQLTLQKVIMFKAQSEREQEILEEITGAITQRDWNEARIVEYMKRMRTPGEWGDHIVIVKLQVCTYIHIYIYIYMHIYIYIYIYKHTQRYKNTSPTCMNSYRFLFCVNHDLQGVIITIV